MNAANEIAVEAFLKREISFTSIPEIIGEVIEKIYFTKDPSLDDIFETDRYARELAIINKQLHLKY
jgi:1-deoxy-D-xylulose-5-phosphate reductoisomerase